jgi:hypothetical protein
VQPGKAALSPELNSSRGRTFTIALSIFTIAGNGSIMGLFGDTDTEQAIYQKLNEYVTQNSVVVRGLREDIDYLAAQFTSIVERDQQVVHTQLDAYAESVKSMLYRRLMESLPQRVDAALAIYIQGQLNQRFDELAQQSRARIDQDAKRTSEELRELRTQMEHRLRSVVRAFATLQSDFQENFVPHVERLKLAVGKAENFTTRAEKGLQSNLDAISSLSRRIGALELMLDLSPASSRNSACINDQLSPSVGEDSLDVIDARFDDDIPF